MYQDHLLGFPRFAYNLFNGYQNLIHFTTTRDGGFSKGDYGGFNLSYKVGEEETIVTKNRNNIAKGLGIAEESLLFAYQMHGDDIGIIDDSFLQLPDKEKQLRLHGVDAMITNKHEVCLCVLAADCGGILLFDPIRFVIGAVHAGWRGVVKRISYKVAESMQQLYQCDRQDILAVIAPCIGVSNYEVGDEVAKAFESEFGTNDTLIDRSYDKAHVNVAEANKALLIAAGLLDENIETSNYCTFDRNDLFYSARQGDKGRFCSGIMMR